MTRRLYLADSYLRECDATVTRVEGAAIVLDQTVAYAESGGQAADHGVISWDGGQARLVDTQVEGGHHVGDVLHKLDAAAPAVGTRVHLGIDWGRRYGLMRHHSAAHVISAVVYRDLKAKFTGGQLYPDRARLDLHVDAWEPDLPARIEARANEEVQKGYRITNREITREEFAAGDLLRTATDLVDPSLSRIRLTDIEGLDVQADGGTHVRDTREIGRIVMGKAENKGKGHRRLSYHCEPAATTGT